MEYVRIHSFINMMLKMKEERMVFVRMKLMKIIRSFCCYTYFIQFLQIMLLISVQMSVYYYQN